MTKSPPLVEFVFMLFPFVMVGLVGAVGGSPGVNPPDFSCDLFLEEAWEAKLLASLGPSFRGSFWL